MKVDKGRHMETCNPGTRPKHSVRSEFLERNTNPYSKLFGEHRGFLVKTKQIDFACSIIYITRERQREREREWGYKQTDHRTMRAPEAANLRRGYACREREREREQRVSD